jgi:AcrR family transcriptional regulator
MIPKPASPKKPTGHRGGRPSRAAAEKIPARIVAAARDEFFAHGYGATSIETIAKAAHVSKRTLYQRFENKAALFHAVVNSLIEGLIPPHVDNLFEGLNCRAVLQKLADAMIIAALSPQSLAINRLLIAEATRFPELALIISEQGARKDAITRIARLLAKETKAGTLDVTDPQRAAELFFSMIVSIPQRRALGLGVAMTPKELKAWTQNAINVFLGGYRV